jgi:hypothetical protein
MSATIPTASTTTTSIAPLKVVRFESPARAFAFCYQVFKADPRFAREPAMAKRLASQIKAGHYLFVMRGSEVVGFTSWLHTSRDAGDAWSNGQAVIATKAVATAVEPAIVVEQWKAATPEVAKFLAEEFLKLTGNVAHVFARMEGKKGALVPVKLRKAA